MAFLAGYLAKARINGVVFAFQRAQCSERQDNQRVTNSEGLGAPVPTPGFHTSVNGNGVMVATLTQPSFDPTFNPFLTPVFIGAGFVISLQVYLSGVGSVSWNAPVFRIIECSQDIDVNTLMPVSFSGESVGPFTRPFV